MACLTWRVGLVDGPERTRPFNDTRSFGCRGLADAVHQQRAGPGPRHTSGVDDRLAGGGLRGLVQVYGSNDNQTATMSRYKTRFRGDLFATISHGRRFASSSATDYVGARPDLVADAGSSKPIRELSGRERFPRMGLRPRPRRDVIHCANRTACEA